MGFCEQFFKKSISEITYNDVIEYFIEERIESIHLEFKSVATNLNGKNQMDDLYKSICAMLNSEGGLLIWGAPREKYLTDEKFKVCIGSLTTTPTTYTKDQIINKVSSIITPMCIGITVAILNNEPNQYIYIFEVPKSIYKPHQCFNTYWIRLDGQTKAAPHYLIESLFKQIRYPQLEGYIKFNEMYIYKGAVCLDISIVIFNFSYDQNEYDVRYTVDIDEGEFADYSPDDPLYEQGKNRLVGKVDVLYAGVPIELYKTIRLDLIDIQDRVNIEEFSQENPFQFELVFGGRVSPLKISYYDINFEDEHFGGKVAKFNTRLKWGYANRVVFRRVENQNVADIQDKAELLEYFLKEKM